MFWTLLKGFFKSAKLKKEKLNYSFDTVIKWDWPNSLDCADLYQCGARRDAELCRVCYKQTNCDQI